MNKKIFSYDVTADLATLKKEGFRVVSVIHTYYTDPWNVVSPKTLVFLERGKKCACHEIRGKHVEIQVEAEPQFEHKYSDKRLSLESFLALPEETIKEQEAREYQEILDASRVTKGGTKVYVVPPKKKFLPPEPESVVIEAEDWFKAGGDRYYKVVIPEVNPEAKRLFDIADTEHINGLGRCWGTFWVQTTESHIPALLDKLTV